jgi:hypothetical protein
MAFSFLPWKNMSAAFASVAGAPVAVVPWGNHFALFATDATGIVCCAGCYPQSGLMGPWAPISDGFSGAPGSPVTVLPWGDHFALFATDAGGVVACAGGDPQNGLMGPWAPVSEDFTGPPAAAVGAVPWDGAFALCAIDTSGTVRTASGDPQNGLSDWAAVPAVPSFTGEPGSSATIVADSTGVDLFTVDTGGAVLGTAGGVRMMTGFTSAEHGWHFDNDFVNELLGGVITTYGLCGGMAYSALDYYFTGIPIPTHRTGDFPSGMTCPPDSVLRSMIYNRLIDSFKDNFTKWSCVYPDLDAGVAAAIGLVWGAEAGGVLGGLGGGIGGAILGALGGGLIGGLLGAGGGWVYGELHEVFECPGGGASGMTRQELPHLIMDFLDKGIPAPIGLIYDRDILNIGHSHQVVAYGYAVVGSQIQIYVYDNRIHDQECMLTIDTEKYGKFTETLTDGTLLPAPNNGNWEGLLVADGYGSQAPIYGQDISIASPQALTVSGKPVILVPATAIGRVRVRASGIPAGVPEGTVPIVIAARQPEPPGQHLTDSFTVQNSGEFPAHYQSLGIEIDPPEGAPGYYDATAAGTDNLLAPGQTMPVTIDVNPFGDAAGVYTIRAGYNTAPTQDAGGPAYWLTLFYPSALVTVT